MRISDWSSDVCSSDLGEGAMGADGNTGSSAGGVTGMFVDIDSDVGGVGAGLPATGAAGVLGAAGAGVADGTPSPNTSWTVQIGRASCRESVWQYVWFLVGVVSLKKKKV